MGLGRRAVLGLESDRSRPRRTMPPCGRQIMSYRIEENLSARQSGARAHIHEQTVASG